MLDLTNLKFGRLTGIEPTEKRKDNKIVWLFRCDCGKIIEAIGKSVKDGNTKSCGCSHIKHGHISKHKKSKTYHTWQSMKDRCINPNNPGYKDYGGRGIKICKRWLKFENFLKDMGERPRDKTLDRIDNDLGYYKKNCKWSTPSQQNRNMRSNDMITLNNITLCLKDWSKKLNMEYMTLWSRIYKCKWSIEKAFTVPVKSRKRN